MTEKPRPACPCCQSEQATTFLGWNVVIAICDACGETYTYPLDRDARRPPDDPSGR